MTTIKHLPLREKYPANGNFFRWGATILIVVLVMFFEFYLFSRYSLWQNVAGKPGESAQLQTTNIPAVLPAVSSPSPEVVSTTPDTPVAPANHDFHPVVPTQAPPSSQPVPVESGESVTIVFRDSMTLMPGTDFPTVLRGILELETKSEYLLAPERETALYKSCLQIGKVWDDPQLRKTETDKCKYLFFASLNQKQLMFFEKNMKSWAGDHGSYKAPENQDQEKYLLEQCTKLLSERAQKIIE